MRMGAFLLGGLVGAAAVVYLTRNSNNVSFATLSSQAGEMVNKVMDTAKSGLMNTKMSKTFSFSNTDSGMDKVERLLQDDPAAKNQVDEMINKNESSQVTQ